MNETANATLALGALPVMAHAREEVEEMAALAGALVLNIGTLSPHWVDAMVAAGRVANRRGVPVVLDPVGAGATAYRTDTARRILDEVDVTVLRGNAGEGRSEEHTSELQSHVNLVCRLLLEKKNREIPRALDAVYVPIKTLPNLRDIIDGKVGFSDIRSLPVEDLLARAPIGLDSRPLQALGA